jgi:hypothetical protein
MVALPPDAILRAMSEIAVERVTTDLASYPRRFAKVLPPQISAQDALMAFANGIGRRYVAVRPPDKAAR